MANREWADNINSRGYEETFCNGEHVPLSEMKMDPSLERRYLGRSNIPPYPSVVLNVSEVCHVTGKSGLQGIFEDGGFNMSNNQDDNFLWWSLSVTEEDIVDAEENFLDELFPDYQAWNQQSFLEHFTTSPAFQSESRYGNFCFTFPLKELLYHYSRQFCFNTAPVLRVLGTKFYKQEIVYSVLVHPHHITRYNNYPRLPRHSNGICGYFGGSMSWHCQAPSNTHCHRMIIDEEQSRVYARHLRGEEYYVWDHVAVAFHMEPNWTLHVNRGRLFNSVSVCDIVWPYLLKEPDTPLYEEEAEEILEDLGSQYGLD